MKELSIKHFRGLQNVGKIVCNQFNIFIGDNGTSKITLLEAVNHIFSPNFLTGRIKHTAVSCKPERYVFKIRYALYANREEK
jgi:AAA15 family ATPase/GTPase